MIFYFTQRRRENKEIKIIEEQSSDSFNHFFLSASLREIQVVCFPSSNAARISEVTVKLPMRPAFLPSSCIASAVIMRGSRPL